MGQNLVIVNTGCANISSVRYALERLGYQPTVSDQADVIQQADKVFLPGVGSANAAMSSIRSKGLETTLQQLTQPTLGICLGMQLMCNQSEEGQASCLGQVNTDVKRMQVNDLRLPHMGWNKVSQCKDSPLFEGINNHYFYFVHSYSVAVGQATLAQCDYAGVFSAAIQQDNFYGVQFHPERSSQSGARLLQNFIEQVAV
jgi:glutamine amidotransferase